MQQKKMITPNLTLDYQHIHFITHDMLLQIQLDLGRKRVLFLNCYPSLQLWDYPAPYAPSAV